VAAKLTAQMGIRFTPEERAQIEAIARQEDRPPSIVVRRMVQAALSAKRGKRR